jgi:dTDP-glucose 4,6-dehydratase
MTPSPLATDLDEIVERSRDDLATLRGSRLFISGGTGFVGKWLLETILWANDRLNLEVRATVLTRDPASFESQARHLATAEAITLLPGDSRTFEIGAETYDGVVHAATPASAEANDREPALVLETIVDGGRRVLELASRSGSIPVLFTSSGAVYGNMPEGMSRFAEGYAGAPDPLLARSAYHEGKRVGELQCALYARSSKIGPYLPLSRHFAAGNFIRDALRGSSIEVLGDGTAVRSYLYAGDMVTWLLAVFVRGEPLRAYNVGSEDAIDMKGLAAAVARCVTAPTPTIRILGRPVTGQAHRYVPDTARARTELALSQTVPLPKALERTMRFHRSNPNEPI